MNLQLSLKTKWFEMSDTPDGKPEDYRELTPYWIKRLTGNEIELTLDEIMSALFALNEGYTEEQVYCNYGVWLKQFEYNIMTLGYPKSSDTSRIKIFEHAGIEIRTGNPKWGAEPGKLYFVIKHGKRIQ